MRSGSETGIKLHAEHTALRGRCFALVCTVRTEPSGRYAYAKQIRPNGIKYQVEKITIAFFETKLLGQK